MKPKLNWGILGTGAIARLFAQGLHHSHTGRLVAVASRTRETADRFADELSVARRYASYEDLLADPEVQIVYIATPHPSHAEWSRRCAAAGKHILCEKPATLNLGDTMAVLEAVRHAGVFWMEAFMYRCHAQTERLVQLIHEGAIGEVRAFQAAFSYNASARPRSRLFDRSLGGGGILDVGCYPVSLARLVAGAAHGRPFEDPVEIVATGLRGTESGVDEQAAAILRFSDGLIAQVSAGLQVMQDNCARVFGTTGWIHLPAPWQPSKLGGEWSFTVHRFDGSTPELVRGEEERSLYAVEADYVAAHLDNRQATSPGMSWADTLGNMRVLDRWREQLGVVYDTERPESNPPPPLGRPPRALPGHRMRFGFIPGLEKPVSRLVMGVDNQCDYPHAAVMFDDFIERGGNAFDTAWIYGVGRCEQLLGHWMKNRGLRDQLVVVGKGGITPHCHPAGVERQLFESLDRLQTDHVDIYLLHRDNPDVPVGEFVDALNSHVTAGRMRVFGGSNWSLARLEEANRYARARGLQGFSLLSNNLSLARMLEPPWPGCVAASDPESVAWLTANRFPNLAWSSQARGFFAERAGPERRDDPELVRCWYSPENFRRRERAIELARRLGVQPINVALAYVLCLPFPSFALIGPRTLDETRSSFAALDLELTPKDLRYLDLGDGSGRGHEAGETP